MDLKYNQNKYLIFKEKKTKTSKKFFLILFIGFLDDRGGVATHAESVCLRRGGWANNKTGDRRWELIRGNQILIIITMFLPI